MAKKKADDEAALRPGEDVMMPEPPHVSYTEAEPVEDNPFADEPTAFTTEPEESHALMRLSRFTGMQRVPVEAMEDLMSDLDAFITKVLVKGVDYDAIPGTNDKAVLLKPGAEKLCFFFRLVPTFPPDLRVRVQDWTGADHNGEPFFYYEYTCRLLRDGAVVAEGVGSVNSWEKKYRYRDRQRACPTCGKENIRRSKPRDGYSGQSGWYCWQKTGGCGANFPADHPEIVSQTEGHVPNPEIFDQVNTMDKMAQKRAFIQPVLLATGTSGRFTQDLDENLHPHAPGVAAWTPEATDAESAVTEATKLAIKAVGDRIPKDQRAGVVRQRLRVLFDDESIKIGMLREEAAQMLLRDLDVIAEQFERVTAHTAGEEA